MSAPEATTVVTGMLPMLLLASAALTAPASLFLLWLYRRAVLRGMAGIAGSTAAERHEPPQTGEPAALTIELIDPAKVDLSQSDAYDHGRRSLGKAVLVYALGGLGYALVLASPWLVFTGDDGVPTTRVLWLLSCYLWPTALAVGMLAAVSRGQRLFVALAYFAMLFAVALYGVFRSSELSLGQVAWFWLFTNAPATLLLLAFLHRRVRAVGPLVLSFMVAAVIGSQIALSAVAASDSTLRAAVNIGANVGLGGVGVFFALMLLGFAIFGLVGWRLLKWIGRRYEHRKMSDQSLTLDAMWLMFGVVQSITFASGGWWILTGLLGFAVYKLSTRTGFEIARVARESGSSPTLLLLRVFALGGKSERLFDAFSKRWLRTGSISMIAGPDLATATVEPHEFLDYVAGRLSTRFVRGSEDLERRMVAMQRGPDPDGRYRVNEFFCLADTWQATMARLSTEADAVLMDLRSFSPSNQGCIFELRQLLDAVPLDRVVFLIDDTTDRRFLEHVLRDSWRHVHPDSTNRRLSSPRARLAHISAGDASHISALLRLLLAPPSTRDQASLKPA
jgi:hypothetical protein